MAATTKIEILETGLRAIVNDIQRCDIDGIPMELSLARVKCLVKDVLADAASVPNELESANVAQKQRPTERKTSYERKPETLVKLLAILGLAIVAMGLLSFANQNSSRSNGGECKPHPTSITNFIWKHDTSEGIAVSFRVHNAKGIGQAQVKAEIGPELSKDWEILEAKAYRIGKLGRIPVSFEGPYRQVDSNSKVAGGTDDCVWNLYDLRPVPYELEILLHRKSDRLSFKETKAAIVDGDVIAFRVVQLSAR